MLELLQARWDTAHLGFATWLANRLLADFTDADAGGFFFTASDHEALIHRSKSMSDEAVPSGNGIAAKVFGRLGHLLGETRYLDAAVRTLKSVWPGMESMPHGHTSLMVALEESLFPYQAVIIRGPEAELENWRTQSARPYAPTRYTLAIPGSESRLPGALDSRAAGQQTLAYICNGMTCTAPVRDMITFEQQLDPITEHA